MKKILLILLITAFSMQICFAEEESYEDISAYFANEPEQTTELHGYLEYEQNANEQLKEQEQEQDIIQLDESVNRNSVNITKPQKIESKSLISGIKIPTFQPIQDNLKAATKNYIPEYSLNSVSASYSEKFGNFTFGTSYNSGLSSAKTKHSTSIFTKYEWKILAISAAFSKNTNDNYNYFNDNFFVAPEIKLTKRLSFLDVMQTDVSQINKSNRLVLKYTPHFKKYADDVELELSAGQNFYNDTYINSSVSFFTKFKL